jgi:hypothetical protein
MVCSSIYDFLPNRLYVGLLSTDLLLELSSTGIQLHFSMNYIILMLEEQYGQVHNSFFLAEVN